MNWMKKALLFFVIFAALVVIYASLTGKTDRWHKQIANNKNKETVAGESQELYEQEIPEQVQQEQNDVIFDAQVVAAQKENCYSGTAKMTLYDWEELNQLYKYFTEPSIPVKQWQSIHSDSETLQIAYESGEKNLVVSEDGLTYTDEVYSATQRSFQLPYSAWQEDQSKIASYLEKRNFSFADEAQALQRALDFLDSMKISLGNNYVGQTYYLDHDTLQKNENKETISGDDLAAATWDEKYDSYYFCLRQSFRGLPVYTEIVSTGYPHQTGDLIAPIQAQVSQSGVDFLSFRNYLEMKDGEKVDLLNFKAILQTIQNHYEPLIVEEGEQFTIKRIELFEGATRTDEVNYELTPVWIVSVLHDSPELEEAELEQMLVDAVTGQEVVESDKY